MSNTVLVANALKKSYLSGDRTLDVLRGVDLTVYEGQTLSIRGE